MRGEYDRNYPTCGVFPELPPRARRIRQVRFRNIPNDGTTSACAENTAQGPADPQPYRNYLRVRGEYLTDAFPFDASLELPPRARRILFPGRPSKRSKGTTSACAENTITYRYTSVTPWNYLRVRGEYNSNWVYRDYTLGTTSACAENTPRSIVRYQCQRNYLRVRGEYTVGETYESFVTELPPRARRIRALGNHFKRILGTTSACAENTTVPWSAGIMPWNYLRVRGEYLTSITRPISASELPPRARRIHPQRYRLLGGGGTTSACAENTVGGCLGLGQFRNYLRVRGEYPRNPHHHCHGSELPPRARRIHSFCLNLTPFIGTTSACAENT